MEGQLRAYLAEAVGTFALIFIGAGSILADAYTGGKIGVTGIALAHGLTIAMMVYAYGRTSGGHFNPAVTAAFLSTRRIEAFKGVLYIVCQLAGAALAGYLLSLIYRGSGFITGAPHLGACALSGVSFRSGALIEAVLTFFLVTVIFATAVDKQGPPQLAPLAIGLTITMGIFMGGPLTGAALNPARAFGPAVASGYWTNHLVYWIGPLLGGVTAGLVYEYLYLSK